MYKNHNSSSPWKSQIFVIAFVAILAFVVWAFIWIVQSASSALPQKDEVISLEEAANHVASGDVEHILIQGEQDIFLYLPGQTRPLYTQVELGKTFTATVEALGVSPDQFPPLTVEGEQ